MITQEIKNMIQLRSPFTAIVGVQLTLGALMIAVSQVNEQLALGLGIWFATLLILTLLVASHRKQTERALQLRSGQEQLAALVSLTAFLEPVAPLPEGRDWAASPDFLRIVADLVLDERPTTVVELGSGYSTLVVGYCLKRLGTGRLVSIDHDAKYVALSRAAVTRHGLDDVVEIVHAPLVEHHDKGSVFNWYATEAIPAASAIDLLIIDGPPANVVADSRHAARWHFGPGLRVGSVVVLDDGDRPAERQLAQDWSDTNVAFDFLPLEKGAFVGRVT